jgi:hypothetical protein
MTIIERIIANGPETIPTAELFSFLVNIPPDLIIPQLYMVGFEKPIHKSIEVPELTPEQRARCMALGELMERYRREALSSEGDTPSALN